MILKLQEVNEKFRQRVQELENIVSKAVDKTQNYSPLVEKAAKQFFSHRVGPFEDDPAVAKKNEALKVMQEQVKHQRETIR